MKVIAFKNEEEYYHVLHKIKKMKKFLTELCNVIKESQGYEGEDDDDEDEEDEETIVYKNGVAYKVGERGSEMGYRGKSMRMKGGRFSY